MLVFSVPVFQICHLPLLKASVSPQAAGTANSLAISCFGIGQIIGNQIGGIMVITVGVGGN